MTAAIKSDQLVATEVFHDLSQLCGVVRGSIGKHGWDGVPAQQPERFDPVMPRDQPIARANLADHDGLHQPFKITFVVQ